MTVKMPPNLPAFTPCEGQLASDWAVALLEYRGCPVNEANVYSFAGWFAEEGGGGENNPMNSTLGDQYPSIFPLPKPQVRSYPTSTVGVEMTWETLGDGYSAIEGAFKAGLGLGSPSAAVAAELGEWSGGGYHAITPRIVPMPPQPSYHYAWYDTVKIEVPSEPGSKTTIREAEVTVVRNYDVAIKHPKVNAKQLKVMRAKLVVYHERIVEAEKSSHDPDGKEFHRAYRKPRIETRANGGVVKPDLG